MDKLAAFLLNEWATDIKKNQLPSLLGGVGPMYSFVQLCKCNIFISAFILENFVNQF